MLTVMTMVKMMETVMTMVTTDHDENCDDIGNDKVEAILVLLVTSSWASFAHTDQTPAVVDEHNDDAHHEDGDEDGDNDDAPSEDDDEYDANDDAPQEDDASQTALQLS